jgi:maltose phosphorylase
MKEGYLERSFSVIVPGNETIEITSRRFVSMSEPDLGLIRYSVRSIDFKGTINYTIYIDGDVKNQDTNYGEKFWAEVSKEIKGNTGVLITSTLKTDFHVATGMIFEFSKDNREIPLKIDNIEKDKYIAGSVSLIIGKGEEIILNKYVSVLSSLNNAKEHLPKDCLIRCTEAKMKGYDKLFLEHARQWEKIWSTSDVIIEGDLSAQQAIRFNIFHLNQTYTGKDERLNIGPKGFTGEKYGGSTYWDTEAFGLPFFLKTSDQQVGKNLLLYRYKHLEKSIENAAKLGFNEGAALYPMVTMNGEECHNEWEITFEEIHRNGAIAFAIFNYIRHTGDNSYMGDYGLEVLIGISRFWRQRASYSENLKKYVILGVTGPNEYENNVNNNWYTNSLAVWTLSYTLKNLSLLGEDKQNNLSDLYSKINFKFSEETKRWKEICENMHQPVDPSRNIFLQQDGFLDKELKPAASISPDERPINQHWSWDRILRSCFIKQADVLQGIYLFEDQFDTATIKRNFDFYEPMSVHESSLSACIHSIVASRIGNIGKAYELYLRTARLDLDDYNNEVGEGLHITSMAGTWLAIVEGFGGMRILDNMIQLAPQIPVNWKSYSFHARFRGILFEVKVAKDVVSINNLSDKNLDLKISGKLYQVKGSEKIILNLTADFFHNK